MVYFQQSLFGRTSWERFFQMTGWTLEPCSQRSQPPTFQCLLLEDGQEPEWCEGIRPISHGGSWTPSIGQAPGWHDGSASFLWQTLEDGVPTKYFLSPATMQSLPARGGDRGLSAACGDRGSFIEAGRRVPITRPFQCFRMRAPPRSGRKQRSETASDCQLTLFPLC